MNKVYQLDSEPVLNEQVTVATDHCTENCIDQLHRRLGHLSEQTLQEMARKELVRGLTISKSSKMSFCEGCIEGKMHRKPYIQASKRDNL